MKALIALSFLLGCAGISGAADYLVVIPEKTAADPQWAGVADVLVKKHSAEKAVWNGNAEDLLPLLKKSQPRWLAVVGRPEDFDAAFVRGINRITRKIDDDPWEDVRWGLITGPDAAAAKRVASVSEPLIIERALNTTGTDMSLMKSGLTLSDGKKGAWNEKTPGGKAAKGMWDEKAAPGGTVDRFAKYWKEQKPQLLVTSSHATQFNLEMPFGLGLIVSHGGKFYVLEKQQLHEFARFLGGAMFMGKVEELGQWIEGLDAPQLPPSPDVPKVWVAAGNCLIGDARGTVNSMLVTALGPGGVRQFVGYVVPTWFGRGGWGTLRLWTGHRGEISLADAFHLNRQRIVAETLRRFPDAMAIDYDGDDMQHELRSRNSFSEGLARLQKNGVKIEKDLIGLIHDRDVVALWGDPKWTATFKPAKSRPVDVSFKENKKNGTLRMIVRAKDEKFSGSVARFLPKRIPGVKATLAGGKPLPENVTVADDFVLIGKLELDPGEKFVLVLKN
jgi:zinc protease